MGIISHFNFFPPDGQTMYLTVVELAFLSLPLMLRIFSHFNGHLDFSCELSVYILCPFFYSGVFFLLMC